MKQWFVSSGRGRTEALGVTSGFPVGAARSQTSTAGDDFSCCRGVKFSPVAKPGPCTKKVVQREVARIESGLFSMILTKHVSAGLLAVILAVGGCASADSPPFVPDATIQALILAKTPLGSSPKQVRAFAAHPDRDVVPLSPNQERRGRAVCRRILRAGQPRRNRVGLQRRPASVTSLCEQTH